ncbi:uncharacterized protein LOC135838131 isoform X2 [Planococcus citri]|uniref:uncharacterized protein LOC135838131 isoform X2 n=1 Tax=Planococcus citri TaxID=170843 RepID=UPI0031F95CD3
MGKVRKLRKKYKALKVATNNMSISKKQIGNVKSAASVSKTNNKSFVSATNLSQNTFQKRQHRSTQIHLDRYQEQVPELDDKQPATQKRNKFKKNKMAIAKANRSRKQVSKTRQNNLVSDIYAFKKILNEESFLKNPQTVIMNQTLEKLSAEEKMTGKGIFAKSGN